MIFVLRIKINKLMINVGIINNNIVNEELIRLNQNQNYSQKLPSKLLIHFQLHCHLQHQYHHHDAHYVYSDYVVDLHHQYYQILMQMYNIHCIFPMHYNADNYHLFNIYKT